MNISDVRRKLGISNDWIAKKLGFKSKKTYENSTAKHRYENLIIEIYNKVLESEPIYECLCQEEWTKKQLYHRIDENMMQETWECKSCYYVIISREIKKAN